jgi:hypothetical protein
MTELEKIETLSGLNNHSCSCGQCVNMCKTAPCIGTPQDILNIINAGYRDKVALTQWRAGVKYGLPELHMVAPIYDDQRGACVFLNKWGLCDLHDRGLKPTEGKLANCKVDRVAPGKYPPAWIVAALWDSPGEAKTISLIFTALCDLETRGRP